MQTETVNQSVERAGIFEFHNSFWMGLHHYLYDEALGNHVSIELTSQIEPQEAATLEKAVYFYRKRFKKHELLLDPELKKIDSELSSRVDGSDIANSDIAEDVRVQLIAVYPIYRKYLWIDHRLQNERWIANAKSLISKYGLAVQMRLEKVLQHQFSKSYYVVDVSAQANSAGAYTVSPPPHIVISSQQDAFKGLASLEILYHESVHAGVFDTVAEALQNEFEIRGAVDRDQVWHAVMYETTGEVVREIYAENGISYVPLRDRDERSQKRAGEKINPVIRASWRSYIQGKVEMQKALSSIVDQDLRP